MKDTLDTLVVITGRGQQKLASIPVSPEHTVLTTLKTQDAVTVGELIDELGMSESSGKELLKRMASNGLIRAAGSE